jgi:hypothetical protein
VWHTNAIASIAVINVLRQGISVLLVVVVVVQLAAVLLCRTITDIGNRVKAAGA